MGIKQRQFIEHKCDLFMIYDLFIRQSSLQYDWLFIWMNTFKIILNGFDDSL